MEDVSTNMRQAFIDEGVDEEVLTILLGAWDQKLQEAAAEAAQTRTLQEAAQQQRRAAHAQQSAPVHMQQMLSARAGLPYAAQAARNPQPYAAQPHLPTGSVLGRAVGAPSVLPPAPFAPQMAGRPAPAQSLHAALFPPPMPQAPPASLPPATTMGPAPRLPPPSTTGPAAPSAQGPAVAVDGQTTPGRMTRSLSARLSQSDGNGESDDDMGPPESRCETNPGPDCESDMHETQVDGGGGAAGADVEISSDDDAVEVTDDVPDSYIICQFEKISHTKAKWKAVLKDGIVHINGKDHLFSKCVGDFDW